MQFSSFFTRAVCVFVLCSFLPAGVQFWNFLPSNEAHAEEPAKGPSSVAAWNDLLTRIKVAALADHEAAGAPADSRQRERLAKHLERVSDPLNTLLDRESGSASPEQAESPADSRLTAADLASLRKPDSEAGPRTLLAKIPYASAGADNLRMAKAWVLQKRSVVTDAAPQETTTDSKDTAAPTTQAAPESAATSTGGADPAPAPAPAPPVLASVADARQMLAAGDYAAGAAALVTRVDWDENPDTRAEADLSLRLLWREAAAGSLDGKQLDAIEAALPAWSDLGTAESANEVMLFSRLRAERHAAAGNREGSVEYYQKAQRQAAEIMEVFPQAPALVETAEAYMDASMKLGNREVQAALAWAWDSAKAKETPRARAFAVRAAAAPVAHRMFSDRLTALVMNGDVMADGKSAEYAEWMKSGAVLPRLKAELSYALALAHYEIGAWGRAAKELDTALLHAPEGDEVRYRAALAQIYILNRIDYEDSEKCLKRLQDYLDKYPESPALDRALMYMAEVYQRTQNNRAAHETYGRVIELFPSSSMREGAERTRKFLEDNVLNTEGGMEVPDGKPVLPAPKFAMSCGPDALNHLLALQGVPATSATLAGDAGTTSDGTALSGMIESARSRAVLLAGVRAEDPARLPVPFVAHTTLNHFFMVTGVTESGVTLRDNVGTQTMALEKFRGVFTGLALVRANAAQGLDVPDSGVMRLAKGGGYPGGCPASCPNGDCPGCDPKSSPTPPGAGDGPPPPPKCGDGDGQGTVGGPGMRLGGGGGGADGHVPGSIEPGMAIFGSGITAPEIQFKIMGRQGSQSVRQTDLSVPIRGGGKLEFTRSYFNSWGTPNNLNDTFYSGFERGLGIGWTHNFSDRIAESTNPVNSQGVPEGFAIATGCTTRYYQYSSMLSANLFEYTIDGVMNDAWNGGALTHELGNRVLYDTSTGRQKIIYPDGSSRTYYGGRVESVTDSNGNTVTLGFADGILDTINGPDDRFLQIYWNDHNRISAVELRKRTGNNGQSVAIRGVSYAYTDTTNRSSLARVTYSDGSYNEFTYGKRYTSDNFYAYISDVRDRSGLHTTLTATYGTDSGDSTWYRVFSQTVTHNATGLHSVYQQDTTSSLVAVSQYSAPSGGTLVSKGVFYGDGSAYHNEQEQFFGDVSGTTKRIWQYSYSYANYRDLSAVYDPAAPNKLSNLKYKYEYNTQGQVTKMYRTPSSPPLEFKYDSTGLRPTKRIDPNLAESTYTRDVAGNVTYYHHPSMGTASVHYVYDAYGQMTSMTDPRGKTWSYTYDTRGNQTSATDPNSHTTTMTYDDFGRVVSVLDPKNKLTEFEYTDSLCGGCGGAKSQLSLIRDHDDNETTFTYDSAGMLTRAENALGQAVVNTYDSMHRLTQTAHENGPTVAVYAYDVLNRVVSAADGDGNSTAYAYNFVGDLTAVTDAVGTTSLVYYNNGNLRQLIEANNKTTNFYYYNAGGLAKMVVDESGLAKTVKYTYDVMGNLTQVGAGTNGTVDTVSYAYPASGATSTGLLQSVTYVNDGVSNTVSYAYNAAGQVTDVTDWLGTSGSTHNFQYDNAGQLVSYTDFDGAYRQYAYDEAGNLHTLRDYDGNTTTYDYDNLHRLASLASPGGKNWGFTYDPVGRLLTQTMPNGISSQYAYDAQGRPSSLQHKDGSTVVEGWNYTYDNNNNLRNVASARAGDSSAWTYLYDGRNRLRHAFHRDAAGALVSRHGFEYGARDNMTVKNVTPYTQKFSDNFSDGNITANPAWLSTGVWSAASQEAVNTPNGSIGPEISQNIANGDAEYWYSFKVENMGVASARTRMVFRRNNATGDALRVVFYANGLYVKQQSGGAVTDLLANTSVVTASNTWYDVYVRASGGTVEVWRGLRGQKLCFLGTAINAAVLSGDSVDFDTSVNTVAHFDDLRMSVPRTANQSFTSTFTGSFDGWVQEVPNTFSTTNGWLINTTSATCKMRRDTANADFQMKFSYRDTSGTPGPEAQVRFRYFGSDFALLRMWPTSFRLTENRSGTNVNLSTGYWATTAGAWYDVTIIADGTHVEVWRGPKGGAQALVCSVDNATLLSGTNAYILVGPTGTYAFDDFQMTAEDLSNTTYAYDAASQLTSMTANGTTTNYTYDDWGRLSGKTQGSYTAACGYRYGDKLAWATSYFPGESVVATYMYDGLGKRRWETVDNSALTWFRWSGWEESAEYAGAVGSWTVGAKQTGYVPGLAAYAGADPATADWRFFLNDHLGSPRQMLGQDKSAKARFDFSPYGELMRSAGLPLTVGYTGHRWDPAIGQYFAPFRYYNPQTARWNMRDPLGYGAGLNMYAYVTGRPTLWGDPFGLCPVTPEQGDLILENALGWLNVDRKEGAGNNSNRRDGVDCTGLTCRVYEDAGFPYPYTPTSSWPPPDDLFKKTDTPQNGDIVVWPGHVGIYDNGSVVHAASGKHQKVVKTPLKYMPSGPQYYRREDPNPDRCQDEGKE